jgi:hypothetical protein
MFGLMVWLVCPKKLAEGETGIIRMELLPHISLRFELFIRFWPRKTLLSFRSSMQMEGAEVFTLKVPKPEPGPFMSVFDNMGANAD